MRQILLAVLLTAGLAGCAARQPATSPVAPSAAQLPWTAAIGKLKIMGARPCTAVLVARDLVVTAAHCLHQNGLDSPIADIAFEPNLGASPELGAFPATDFRASGGAVTSVTKGSQIVRDWALIGVVPLPPSLAPIPAQALVNDEILTRIASGQSLYTAGYGNGNGDLLRRHTACKVIDDPTLNPLYAVDMLITTCIIFTGDSGGPILLVDPAGRAVLIGIFSGFGLHQATGKSYGVSVHAFADHLPAPLISQSDKALSLEMKLALALN